MKKYNHKKIEKKWQKYWEENPELYSAQDNSDKPKWYTLVEFPYPSGAGLHIGHVRSYTALDIISRKLRMQGFNVMYPIGWDAFGLPTENYAIKNKIHPRAATEQNVTTFKRQLKNLGLSYDWSREINTTDPKYYKWTQWIFLKFLEKGLAYKKKLQVNWCPSCKIVLANEEVVGDKCERCGSQVTKKEKEQWLLAITKYADRLIDDLETVDYLDKIKTQQVNWIGRSNGVQFEMNISGMDEKIEVYTTRIDTVFGMTYVVVAPEHPILEKLKNNIENYVEVEQYIIESRSKTDLERTELQKEKTGLELKGIKIVNPFNEQEISLFVADYVLGFYGTGAVMAVPAHDERDYEFATRYNASLTNADKTRTDAEKIEIKQSIAQHFIDKNNPPQKGKKPVSRRAVQCVVKHWEKDQILNLHWKKFPWKTFIIGGIKDGETVEECALRELKEETGYKNIKSIKKIGGEFHSEFFAAHKRVNRYAYMQGVYIELADGEKQETALEEHENFDIVWTDRKKVAEKLTSDDIKNMWDNFQKSEEIFIGDGILINSEEFDGLSSEEARKKMTTWLEKNKIGKMKINYKLRDWIFSRQHYWGEPIPVIHCEECGVVPVPEDELPVELPDVKSYEPTDTGESPLSKITEWVNVKCPKCGKLGKRETDTMPNWAGSSWYFLRYIDENNGQALADPEKLKYWMPVDLYNGGMEHTTLHLLYSRFWNKFLFDIGVSPVSEPYARRRSHGMVLAEDGKKMSKSLGNVVNPDEIVGEFGADALRTYEMFMGPFDQSVAWSTAGVNGLSRFLEKVWKIFQEKELVDCGGDCKDIPKELPIMLHKTIKKVTNDIESFNFNTAISQMMIFVNEFSKHDKLPKAAMEKFLILLAPFAPHMTEEIWSEILGHEKSIFQEKWPEFDEAMTKDEEIEIVVQVNGKIRDRVTVNADISEEEAKKLALESEKVQKFIDEKEVRKVIYVKGKLVSIVI